MKTIITVLVLSLTASIAAAQPKGKEVIHCVKVGKTYICTSN